MTSALDMSLDDLIKNNKKPSGGAPRGRGGRGSGPARRAPNRAGNRSAPYSIGKAPDSAWQHDMYSDQMAAAGAVGAAGTGFPGARSSGIETGTKLYISNLDYGVSNEDIKELFSEVGDLKRYSINYDRSGRSKGTAEVVFSRRTDALAAVKRYNNVQLDGKPMKIEIIGTNIESPAVVPFAYNGTFGNLNGAPKSGPGRGGFVGWPRGGGGSGGASGSAGGGGGSGGGGGGGRGRGRGRGGGGGGGSSRGRGRGNQPSAADLDADLDKYHAESMQIN
ncbi:THO complex subunit 4A-like [Typha angustifolia]|uniref:THO complex subunit 4A-like n=1 Tax=Typha angustifolia TaxID=59011 RepID=UPI003C2F75E4